jgi:hypothetical protein
MRPSLQEIFCQYLQLLNDLSSKPVRVNFGGCVIFYQSDSYRVKYVNYEKKIN